MNIQYSVLMTVYKNDCVDWFCESIESMLSQTLMPNELVIVCDGPLTSELEQAVDDYATARADIIRVHKLPKNLGLGLALRYGVERCSYEYIARMDADDISAHERCELQLALMQEHPELSMVGSNTDEFSENPQTITAHRIMPETHDEIMRFAKGRTPFAHQTFVFKKSALIAAGNYADCLLVEDYDVMSRMLQMGCLGYNIQKPLVFVRVNDGLYSRRGGKKYLTQMLSFNKLLYKRGFYNFRQYITRSAIQTLVSSMPNNLRSLVYKKILRG